MLIIATELQRLQPPTGGLVAANTMGVCYGRWLARNKRTTETVGVNPLNTHVPRCKCMVMCPFVCGTMVDGPKDQETKSGRMAKREMAQQSNNSKRGMEEGRGVAPLNSNSMHSKRMVFTASDSANASYSNSNRTVMLCIVAPPSLI